MGTVLLVTIDCAQCTRCLFLKRLTDFSVCAGKRHSHCKRCRSAYGGRKCRERTARRQALGLCRPVGRPRGPRRLIADAPAARRAQCALATT
jgi:hypothetical protein